MNTPQSSKQRFSLEEIAREGAQTPPTGRMYLPVHVVRTFVNAANGETMPSIEDWALAARLTAAELSKAGAEIERLRAGLEEIAHVIGDNYNRCWMRVKAREILRGETESRDG